MTKDQQNALNQLNESERVFTAVRRELNNVEELLLRANMVRPTPEHVQELSSGLHRLYMAANAVSDEVKEMLYHATKLI